MSRRKQPKPRPLKHDVDRTENMPTVREQPIDDEIVNIESLGPRIAVVEQNKWRQTETVRVRGHLLELGETSDLSESETTSDSLSDIYSSHTSSASFSPSPSDGGGRTPNSLIHDQHSAQQHLTPQDYHHHHHQLQQQQQQSHHLHNHPPTHHQLLQQHPHLPPYNHPLYLHQHHHHHPQLRPQSSPRFKKSKLAEANAAGSTKSSAGDTDTEPAKSKTPTTGKGQSAEGEAESTSAAAGPPARGEGTYQCQFCDKSFPRLGYLKKHEQSHAEHMPFKCDYCARLFKHKRSRDRHTKLHTGDRRYRCPHCEAAFSRSDHLKIHMKTHDNQKPFQCTVCNRGYNTAAALTSHMQNHKKQQAAMLSGGGSGGGSNLAPGINYSPRSTGSTGSSTASSLRHQMHYHVGGTRNKRKYSPHLMAHRQAAAAAAAQQAAQLQHQAAGAANSGDHSQQHLPPPPAQTTSSSSSSTANMEYTMGVAAAAAAAAAAANSRRSGGGPGSGTGRLYCMYCTQSDFPSLDALHGHIQAAHSALGAPIARDPLLTQSAAYFMPPHSLSCEFCTMKFSSLPLMLQHLKSTHLDRVPSPSAYTDSAPNYASALAAQQSPNSGRASAALSPPAKSQTPSDRSEQTESPGTDAMTVDAIKTERSLSCSAASNEDEEAADEDRDDEDGTRNPADEGEDKSDSKRSGTSTPQIKRERPDDDQAEQECATDLSKRSASPAHCSDQAEDDRRSVTPAPSEAATTAPTSPQSQSSSAAVPNGHPPNTQTQGASMASAAPGALMCNQCNAALPDFDAFRAHLKAHLTQNMNTVAASQQQQQQHHMQQQQQLQQQQLQCPQCGLAQPNSGELERHVHSHYLIAGTEYYCSHSGCNRRTFGKSDELQKHLLEAHAQTLLRCTVCADLFETRVALQVHFAVAHTAEVALMRCSACSETFRSEAEFRQHVRSRHWSGQQQQQLPANGGGGSSGTGNGMVQCVFCRTVCASEIEMHFHLAAHARPFRCPVCPESFHVEFLLDRHLQTHHQQQQQQTQHQQQPPAKEHAALTFKPAPSPAAANIMQNNNNSILDYHYAAAAAAATAAAAAAASAGPIVPKVASAQPASSVTATAMYNLTSKYYSNTTGGAATVQPTQQSPASAALPSHPAMAADTKHPLYGFYDAIQKSRAYDADTAKNLLGIYRSELAAKLYASNAETSSDTDRDALYPPKRQALGKVSSENGYRSQAADHEGKSNHQQQHQHLFCGICEKRGFASEAEVHTHRKVVHNVKTGVSLKCAYCSGNFRSRHDLETHMKIAHNGTGKHKCLICDEVFPSPAVLAEHKLGHSKVGQSGQCSRCPEQLRDAAAFKAHMSEHGPAAIPAQCVCCRQTLHSEFEVDLHAKFHTKSAAPALHDPTCALCLLPLPADSDTKICEKCYRKHNLSARFPLALPAAVAGFAPPPSNSTCSTSSSLSPTAAGHPAHQAPQHSPNQRARRTPQTVAHTSAPAPVPAAPLMRCNLCSVFGAPSVAQLQQHLIEHSFEGCVERGYACYICAAVFTGAAGLQLHMHEQHGDGAKPYDCGRCGERFFFRAELQHHAVDEERRDAMRSRCGAERDRQPSDGGRDGDGAAAEVKAELASRQTVGAGDVDAEDENMDAAAEADAEVGGKRRAEDEADEEYIEVEKLGELAASASAAGSSSEDETKSEGGLGERASERTEQMDINDGE